MNRSELVQRVAYDVSINKSIAEKCVNTTFDIIKIAVKEGVSVTLIGFGTFEVFSHTHFPMPRPIGRRGSMHRPLVSDSDRTTVKESKFIHFRPDTNFISLINDF
jgi:hypothetical protein